MPSHNELEMLRAAQRMGIQDRNELANLMAQLGHESAGFRKVEEGFRYTKGIQQIPVSYARREGEQALERARLEALDGAPEALARLMYGGRMGNDDAGDGYRYRGRGFTQLTGKANYRDAAEALDIDLVRQPDLAAQPENAARIALWYWRERVPAADRDDVTAASRRVNGGAVGLEDRHARFDAWHAVLTPRFLAELDQGRVPAGPPIGPAPHGHASQDGALRRFERGADISELQTMLRSVEPDRRPSLAVSGQFDASTEQAVRRFQEQAGLAVTGRADAQTMQCLEQRFTELDVGARRSGQPSGPSETDRLSSPVERLSDADVRLLDGIRRCVAALDMRHGKTFDDGSERAAWALLPQAKARGMTDPQHAVVSIAGPNTTAGQHLFLVQGALDDPARLRVHVNTVQAMQTPIEESLAKVQAQGPVQSAETQRIAQLDQEQSRVIRMQA